MVEAIADTKLSPLITDKGTATAAKVIVVATATEQAVSTKLDVTLIAVQILSPF